MNPTISEYGAALYKLREMCGAAAVSFSLNYDESCDSWYVEIHSAAAVENFMGKSYMFDTAIECAVEFLEGLGV